MTEGRIATWLIAHTNPGGTGVAQTRIKTTSEKLAREWFKQNYPEREILRIGIEGLG